MTIETANKLIEYRKKAGLSQEELADKLGVSIEAVSKWEKGEASPDTDNLIALAKLYGVSLDELVGNAPKNNENKEDKVIIDKTHITVEDKDGSKVEISSDGINIKDGNESIHIGHDSTMKKLNNPFVRFWLAFEGSFTLIILLVYIIVGCCYKGTLGTTGVNAWAGLWPLFLMIPIPSSLRMAIQTKRFCVFAFPFLITSIYCFLGMLMGIWHPMWMLFLFIPIYYCYFGYVDKRNHSNYVIDNDNGNN